MISFNKTYTLMDKILTYGVYPVKDGSQIQEIVFISTEIYQNYDFNMDEIS
jgi:hypothetical protein